jgi:hypothetical protein
VAPHPVLTLFLIMPLIAFPSSLPSSYNTLSSVPPRFLLLLPHPPRTDDVLTLTHTYMSPAKQTIQHYQPAPSDSPVAFPINPITNFQSCYPVGFSGCMFCGATEHIFRLCPHNTTPGASATFCKHLFAHKPHLRERDPVPRDMLPSPSGISVTQSFPVSAPAAFPPSGHPRVSPSVSTASLPPLGSPAPPPPSIVPKKAHFFVQLVKSFLTHLPASRLVLPPSVPIAIDNGLPHITFDLGAETGLDPSLCGLMDACGALNNGYLLFHLWLKSERPDLVTNFVSFDDSNPFEPIKLGGAIRDPSDFDATDHGNLTAVIRYYTPYVDIFGSPTITISFALGSDVTVNTSTIFGLTMLCDLDAVISLQSNSMRHESKIIMEHLEVLKANGWIRKCFGPWGSSIVLASKPHQEHIIDICDFIWCLCVSYRHLNQVTLPFEYPIPCCDDAIDTFGDSSGRLSFIALDNKTGYHQICVRLQDQEKLAFFAPYMMTNIVGL